MAAMNISEHMAAPNGIGLAVYNSEIVLMSGMLCSLTSILVVILKTAGQFQRTGKKEGRSPPVS
jgi:hypothetical protein